VAVSMPGDPETRVRAESKTAVRRGA
jgi:hypothetical protein